MKKVLAFLLAIFCPLSVMALESIDILSDEDAAVYQQIFLLQDKEKIDSAKKLENKLMDKSLMHEVLYQRFVSKTYHTRGVEIQNWMNKNYDMPGAERLAKIANLKKVSVKKPVSPHILTGKEYIETAQSETWTAKNYSGKAAKKIEKFKKREEKLLDGKKEVWEPFRKLTLVKGGDRSETRPRAWGTR